MPYSSLFGTPHGNLTAPDGGGGTLESPFMIGGDIGTVDFPGGKGWMFVHAGTADRDFSTSVPFDSWKIHGPSIPFDGQVREGLGWINAYSEYGTRDSYYHNGLKGQFLVPSECLPIWEDVSHLGIPDTSRVNDVRLVVNQTMHADWLMDQERLAHFVGLHRDGQLPPSTPNQKTDMGSVLRHINRLTGGDPATGWYPAAMLEGDQFASNDKYNQGLSRVLAFLYNPCPETWYSAVYLTYAHLFWGRVHYGRDRGQARYPKASVRQAPLGDAPSWYSNDPAKQFQMTGVILMQALTGCPVMEMFIEEWRDYLRRDDPARVWPGGRYGARRPMRRLLEYVLAYATAKDDLDRSLMQDKADVLMAIVDAHFDPVEGCWPNPANDPQMAGAWTKDTSPWMQWKLLLAVAYSVEQGLIPSDLWNPKLLVWAERIWDDSRTWAYGGRVLNYRYDGSGKPNLHRSGWLVAALRHLASLDPGKWQSRYESHRDLVLAYAGSSMDDVMAEIPRPIADIGALDGPNGVAWFGKTMQFYIDGMII